MAAYGETTNTKTDGASQKGLSEGESPAGTDIKDLQPL